MFGRRGNMRTRAGAQGHHDTGHAAAPAHEAGHAEAHGHGHGHGHEHGHGHSHRYGEEPAGFLFNLRVFISVNFVSSYDHFMIVNVINLCYSPVSAMS
jgi:hypothetical protein